MRKERQMNRRISIEITILVITCFFASSCIFPTSSTTVKGRVFEYGRKPVADAEVSFGGTGFETITKTDADGNFTASSRHRPTQMLYLKISKEDFAVYEDKFPGFAAPEETVEIELLKTIPRRR
jgi:hypothetical protein